MKNKLKIIFILSVLLNVFLIFISFTTWGLDLRIRLANFWYYSTKRIQYVNLGDTLLLRDYQPESGVDTIDQRTHKYPSMPVYETHGHLGKFFNVKPDLVSKKLTELNIKKFINLSITTGEDFIKTQREFNDPRIVHFSTFNWKRLENVKDDSFVQAMVEDLKKDIQNGSRGIKLWKNLGLKLKKPDGSRLKVNDPILYPLFELCQKHNLIISIHTADPIAFFKPNGQKNERYEEIIRHPDWSFASKEFPSRDTVLDERNALFQRFPNLRFIALHFGEYAESPQKVEKLLDENPNVYIDIAARVDELGRIPLRIKKLILKYQDRILFGTDGPPDSGKYEIYSRFLETEDEYFDYYPENKQRKGFWKIYGIKLDKDILEKIYYKNAEKLFGF